MLNRWGHIRIELPQRTYQHVPQESELVVAIFRTVLVFLAALTATLSTAQGTGMTPAMRLAMQLSIFAAMVYNAVLIVLALLRVRLRGQRQLTLLLDVLLVTVWIVITWGQGGEVGPSPLFPFYYLIIIIGALWFGITGALTVATVITVAYLLAVNVLSLQDALALVDAIFRQVLYLFLVGLAAGYVVDTHSREREQWARAQVLLAQYQERFRAAQEVYELLIPAQLPRVPGLDMAARWRSAVKEGGGDFYDVLVLPDGRVVVTVADVSGKSTRGSLKLPLFKAAFLAVAQVFDDPGRMLAEVNRIVYAHLQPEMFISACLVILDPARHTVRYASAGQDAPIYARRQRHETVQLETGGLLLGIDDHARYPSEEQRLEPGDTLCLFTDGVSEARNPEGEEFGLANLTARVMAGVAIGLTADAIAENVVDAVHQHAAGERRHDDMTLLVIRFQPGTSELLDRTAAAPSEE